MVNNYSEVSNPVYWANYGVMSLYKVLSHVFLRSAGPSFYDVSPDSAELSFHSINPVNKYIAISDDTKAI